MPKLRLVDGVSLEPREMQHPPRPTIVGIGASAGCVGALQDFLRAIPSDTGAAFVVVVHLDPNVRSALTDILGLRTSMPVAAVEGTRPLEGNRVYVVSPNHNLEITDHSIAAVAFEEPVDRRAPIDLFFRSLASQRNDAFAIILTGAGADGAVGVQAIKEAGGIVLVQDPAEAEYASMPQNAIATEAADFVLPIKQLAHRLSELLRLRAQLSPQRLQSAAEEGVRKILSHVRVRTGHDFGKYKRSTILRRITRRMQITRRPSFDDYYAFLRDNVEEAQALFSEFLISVTTFFRDGDAFAALAREALPQLFSRAEAGTAIRVWVPGCATGEEAYSVAMLLLEEAARREVRPEIQVFGSDLDEGALSIAREGRFPLSIEADVTQERLARFFVRESMHYRVRRELRDIVLFASHSLLRDPPFSRLDMVTCRNLLIYLDKELQQHVCTILHYALKPGGILFLGTSESADHPPGLFRPIVREARIYRSIAAAGDKRTAFPGALNDRLSSDRGAIGTRFAVTGAPHGEAALHRQMLERIAPPSMLIDESHRAIHLSENAGRYLRPSGGPVSTDAVDLVRPELRFDLRAALNKAFERGESTLSLPIPVQFNGTPHRTYINVRPVVQDDDKARYALVLFFEGEAVEPDPGEARGQSAANREIRALQQELRLTQGRLQATREEAEGINEELRAANEEMLSINEEHRSTAEELETSKEELQSINEELQTVNNELKLKLESISRAHSDLQNLMAATDVATLFLDTGLNIKRFTPRLTELFNVTESDEGRPITDFTHRLKYNGIAEHARVVLRDLAPVEHEVQSRSAGWYLVRIRPYRTVDDKIDGVVATFVDITARRETEAALLRSQERLDAADQTPPATFAWELGGAIVHWSRGAEALFGFSVAEALGSRESVLLRPSVGTEWSETVLRALVAGGSWRGNVIYFAKAGRSLNVATQLELIAAGDRKIIVAYLHDGRRSPEPA